MVCIVSSESVSCPFSDAYWLAYNNNSGGFCAHPASYISPCASNNHLHFRMQKCSHAAYTYQRGSGDDPFNSRDIILCVCLKKLTFL